MSEGTGAPNGAAPAVPGAVEAATNTAPTDSAETQIAELDGERVYSEEEAPDFGQWKHKLQARNGADPEEVTYEDLTSGYMRQQDYTRKTQEIRAARQQHEKTARQTNALVQRMKNAEGLIEWLDQAGFPIGDAMDHFNKRVNEEASLDPREQYERQRQRDLQLAQQKQEVTERKMQAMEQAQAKASWSEPVHEWTGAALDAVELPRDKEHLGLLIRELQPILSQQQRPVSRDDVMQAAKLVDKRLSGYATRRGLVKAPKKDVPASVRPGESYGQKQAPLQEPKKQKSMTDWNKKMRALGRNY